MASFDRKAFLSLPTGSSYLECSSNNNYYSLYPGSSTHIFCAKAPKGFLFVTKVPQKITHGKMLAHAEDDPAELLKVMDALRETVRSIYVDEPLVATFPKFRRSQWVDATLARSLLAGVSKAKFVPER
jgi:uncharacterized protein YecE (DUF72 family)